MEGSFTIFLDKLVFLTPEGLKLARCRVDEHIMSRISLFPSPWQEGSIAEKHLSRNTDALPEMQLHHL